MDILELESTPLAELRQTAKELEVTGASRLKKEDLVMRIRQAQA